MKKLYIDYEICNKCPECVVKCSYVMHPENNGITSLRELVSFMFVCRRCEDYPCVNACPNGALKRQDNIIKRAKFLCISCKSCAIACPFGTILPEFIPYLVSSCDFCLNRLREEKPVCVDSCPYNAIKFLDEEEGKDEKHIHKLGENLIVKAVSWLELNEIKK